MKRFRQSSKPRLAESGMNGNWTNYTKIQERNPTSIGKGRVNKKRVLQIRYLQSKGIKPVSKDILQWLNSAK